MVYVKISHLTQVVSSVQTLLKFDLKDIDRKSLTLTHTN